MHEFKIREFSKEMNDPELIGDARRHSLANGGRNMGEGGGGGVGVLTNSFKMEEQLGGITS